MGDGLPDFEVFCVVDDGFELWEVEIVVGFLVVEVMMVV